MDHAPNPTTSPTITTSPKAITKRQATFQQPPQTPASAKLSLFHGPKIDDPDPASDRLDDDLTPLTEEHFYELIGMKAPDKKKDGHHQLPKDLATSHGLYGAIRSRMRYVQWKYRIFDIATYVFLAMQLLLSAVFIVLGSIRANAHIAIAVLGAVSAVIGGVMSLMKGQGLPNRLRQARDDLKNVLFAAEELYWDVQAGRSVLFKDIVKIRESYLRVLSTLR